MELAFENNEGEVETISGVKNFEIEDGEITFETHGGVKRVETRELVAGEDNRYMHDLSRDKKEEEKTSEESQ